MYSLGFGVAKHQGGPCAKFFGTTKLRERNSGPPSPIEVLSDDGIPTAAPRERMQILLGRMPL